MICKAHNRQGEQCKNPVTPGFEVCRFHGGHVLSGRPIVHGRRSKALKKLGLSTRFKEAFNDPAILVHRENIATHEVLINEVLEGTAPTLPIWIGVKEQYVLVTAAKGQEARLAAFEQLGVMLDEGIENSSRINRALELMELQRRHKDSEAKRESDLATNLRAREANALMLAVAVLIESYVPKELLPAAAKQFTDLMQTFSGGEVVIPMG